MIPTSMKTTSFLLALLCGGASPCETSAADRPNIIVILADDLGWADLSCYGSEFHETPNLDRLAAEGVRFTQGYAAHSYCSPTRAALLTGRDPARLGITDYIPSNFKSGRFRAAPIEKHLPLEEVTLPEILREEGYATWHVGKWHLGEKGFFPEDQGFAINIAGNQSGAPASFFWPYGHDNPKAKERYHGSPVPGLHEGGKEGEHLCDRLTSEAIALIEKRPADQPFFLYLPYYSVHTPTMGEPELVKKYTEKARRMGLPTPVAAERFIEGQAAHGSETREQLIRQCNPTYAAMIETMDTNIGRLLARLDDLALRENTIVVFSSDNGGLNQHNSGQPPVTSNAPLRAGKGWLYEGGVRVPWIVRFPGRIPSGLVSEVPIVTTDLAPTLLALAGLPLRPALHLDGRSFVPALEGRTDPIHESICWHFPHYGNTGSGPCGSIRQGDWKLIHWMENDSVELFHLRRDPGEATDLASTEPEKAAELRQRLEAWREKVGARPLRPKP